MQRIILRLMKKVVKMADETLQGLKIAILVTDGFEEVELTEPAKRSIKPAPTHSLSLPRATRCAGGTSLTGAKRFQSI